MFQEAEMSGRSRLIVGVLAAVVALGGFGYWFVLREPEAPSGPIQAIPLESDDESEPATEQSEPSEGESGTASESAVEAIEGEVVESNPITWSIDPNQSSARFELDEDLQGQRITVVGTADQVAGQMRFDTNDLSTAEIGIIQINARTFVTDDNRRNNAIQNRILQTGEHEFITFIPTNITRLPESVSIRDDVQFQIEGDLTIRDVTNPVAFDAMVKWVDTNTIDGTASTVIDYSDWGINIPNVPAIANVEEELEIYIDFRANPAE